MSKHALDCFALMLEKDSIPFGLLVLFKVCIPSGPKTLWTIKNSETKHLYLGSFDTENVFWSITETIITYK